MCQIYDVNILDNINKKEFEYQENIFHIPRKISV